MCEKVYLESLLKKVIEVIKLVASPPDIQVRSFPKCVFVPDEIADAWEEIMLYSKILVKEAVIDDQLYQDMIMIDNEFIQMSPQEYDIEKLYHATTWDRLRKLSKMLLESFHTQWELPNLFWYQYL